MNRLLLLSRKATMADNVDRGPAENVRSQSDAVPSDGSLLRKYRHGDQEAARLLYLRYAGRLRALARAKSSPELAGRVDDDDIVQSVFGSFFRGVIRGSYDVPAGEELWSLFLVITLNKIRAKGAHHRAAKRDVRLTTGDQEIEQSPDPLSSDGQAGLLLKMAVDEVLEQLPEQIGEAVRLRMQGYEVAEIARITGRAKRSVERNLQRGGEEIAKRLGK
jgi:RNA polymerase sigma-70 factor (ECF subfamily)